VEHCSCAVLFMCSTVHVQFCSCAVLFMCSTVHVQYCSCGALFMCSTVHVQYCSCGVLFMCSTVHVQYCSCAVLFMCSSVHVQYCSCGALFMCSTVHSRQILIKLEFLDKPSKNNQISNFMKIRPVGAELLHADGQTYIQTDRQDKPTHLKIAPPVYSQHQWRTQEFFRGGSTNSVEDRENGDLGAVAP
jgi:hypothetical protein